ALRLFDFRCVRQRRVCVFGRLSLFRAVQGNNPNGSATSSSHLCLKRRQHPTSFMLKKQTRLDYGTAQRADEPKTVEGQETTFEGFAWQTDAANRFDSDMLAAFGTHCPFHFPFLQS